MINTVMHDLRRTAFIVTMFYHDGGDEPRQVTEGAPRIQSVRYSDITVDGTTNAATIADSPRCRSRT